MKRIHVEHPEAGGVGGAVLGADSDRRLLSRIADVAAFSSPSQPGFVRTIAGVNVSYKRSVLQAVGIQDESFFINCGEDVDFNWRIKQLGYQIFYHPEIKVLHHHRSTLKQFIHQFYMYGRAYYLVRCKWPEMYCIYPHKFSTFKDLLKAANFLVALVYQPFLHMMRMTTWKDKLRSLPLFFAIGLAWRGGIVSQRLRMHQ
jgi:GT2 family glycosyltransferase